MEPHEALAAVLTENIRLRQKLTDMRYLMFAALTQNAPEEPAIEWLKSNYAETQYRIRQAAEAAG